MRSITNANQNSVFLDYGFHKNHRTGFKLQSSGKDDRKRIAYQYQ